MKSRCIITMAFAFAAICAQARFVYTETNATEVASGKDGKGTLTDGIWLLGAVRPKNTNNLNVNGAKGDFLGSEPSPLNLTEIYSQDGETQYHAVSFETLSHYNGASKSTLFAYKDMITEFIAPDCQKTSGNGCFLNCTELTNVQLNATVTQLGGDRPFMGCVKLAAFYPRTLAVSSLTTQAFKGCAKLPGSFDFPNLTSLPGQAFADCALLTGITAPKVTSIGESVFASCASLTTASFSTNLVSISNYAFSGCTSLGGDAIRAILHRRLVRLGSNDIANQLGIFMNCTSLSGTLDWAFPLLNTNVVAGSMFDKCSALTRVNILTDVAEIKSSAFRDIAEGAEVHMPVRAPAVYGSDAVCRFSAPYPKVYLKDNFDAWIAVMRKSHHVILREEFNDTSWSDTYGNDTKSWSIITTVMARDAGMCTKTTVNKVTTVTVPDKKVIAFVMRGNNTGCWVLREPRKGMTLMVQ